MWRSRPDDKTVGTNRVGLFHLESYKRDEVPEIKNQMRARSKKGLPYSPEACVTVGLWIGGQNFCDDRDAISPVLLEFQSGWNLHTAEGS
jgi:hypothetical protein